MRRALCTAALTFSFLMTPVALAQSAGSGAGAGTSSQPQSGIGANQEPGTYPSGTFSVVPYGSTGAEDISSTTTTQGTGGSGNTSNTNAGGTNNGTGGGDTGNNASDARGTGGSGNTSDGNQDPVPAGRPEPTRQGTEPRDAAGEAKGGSAEAAGSGEALSQGDLTREVAMLRSDVLRLQRQVNALRGGHANDPKQQQDGTGGSGPASAPRQDDSGDVNANPEKTIVANVVMRGQVTSATQERIVIKDAETGDLYDLRVGENTRIVRNGQRISTQGLRQGTAVQAAYNLIADGTSDATRIQVTPRSR
ncbi:hypothetical protein LXT21_10965 [Myxococcus sp. K38C18041901]|uniref:hypothetical protein n=1 Tax=Myxococcus guangdongensis TaxID=2906760 RepID=UPI0020A6FB46|nr:hypothetical protein [Myxococcus guangdongensis]MCP3059294.1 hypothetical protein [Myxococcus guangdongensis]